MSFSTQVKEELLHRQDVFGAKPKACCHHAELYGLMLCNRDFSKSEMSIKTENSDIAEKYARGIEEITGNMPAISCSSAGKYRVQVTSLEDRKIVLAAFGHSGNEVTQRLNRANLEYDCCNAAVLRGAFLSCGTITDPEKDYHLEFILSHKVLCNDFMKLFSELDLQPKYVLRNGAHVIYFKDSESVEDLLTLMGATESTLELMGTKMYKDMRNQVNRRMNFENANSSRSFDAAYKQMEAIRYIEEQKGLQYLPNDLRELAILRKENPDYTLNDLADNLKTPISKSGVNHRLKRILETAEDLRLAEKKAAAKEKK